MERPYLTPPKKIFFSISKWQNINKLFLCWFLRRAQTIAQAGLEFIYLRRTQIHDYSLGYTIYILGLQVRPTHHTCLRFCNVSSTGFSPRGFRFSTVYDVEPRRSETLFKSGTGQAPRWCTGKEVFSKIAAFICGRRQYMPWSTMKAKETACKFPLHGTGQSNLGIGLWDAVSAYPSLVWKALGRSCFSWIHKDLLPKCTTSHHFWELLCARGWIYILKKLTHPCLRVPIV